MWFKERVVQRLGGGEGGGKFIPASGRDGTKITLLGDVFHQFSGGISLIRGKPADHVRDHVIPSPKGAVLMTSPRTESSSDLPPPQSLND